MERRGFIKQSCTVCMGLMAGVSIVTLMDACATGKIVKSEALDNKISVNISEFKPEQSFIIVRASSLNFDILLHKDSDTAYTALLMQCTHYDNPVFANNKEIFCPSHGSKFDFSGKVLKEPATQNLKHYKTELNTSIITIFLS